MTLLETVGMIIGIAIINVVIFYGILCLCSLKPSCWWSYTIEPFESPRCELLKSQGKRFGCVGKNSDKCPLNQKEGK